MCSSDERDTDQASSRVSDEVQAGPRPSAEQELTPEKKAAIELAIARMREGLPLGMTRPFTRDEMHER